MRDATRGLKIPLGGDRLGRSRSVFGVMPFTVKVSSHDSDGTALVIEQANAYRGGGPFVVRRIRHGGHRLSHRRGVAPAASLSGRQPV